MTRPYQLYRLLRRSVDVNKPSLVYLVENPTLQALKVGIMNSHSDRLKVHKRYGWLLRGVWQFESGRDIYL